MSGDFKVGDQKESQRGLGFQVIFARSDLSVFKNYSEAECDSVISNCNIKIAMKINDEASEENGRCSLNVLDCMPIKDWNSGKKIGIGVNPVVGAKAYQLIEMFELAVEYTLSKDLRNVYTDELITHFSDTPNPTLASCVDALVDIKGAESQKFLRKVSRAYMLS